MLIPFFFLIISIYFASMGIFMLRLLRNFWIILGNVELYIAIVVYEFDIVKPVLAVTPGEWSLIALHKFHRRGVLYLNDCSIVNHLIYKESHRNTTNIYFGDEYVDEINFTWKIILNRVTKLQ